MPYILSINLTKNWVHLNVPFQGSMPPGPLDSDVAYFAPLPQLNILGSVLSSQ